MNRRQLGNVGLAAIKAKYPTGVSAKADPVGAVQVAKDAMAAILGVPSEKLKK